MTNTDAPEFERILETLFAPHGRKADKSLKRAWWIALCGMSLDQFAVAAGKYLQTGERVPLPAHIRNLAGMDHDGHVDADEAWTIALASYDESATVCVNQEIMEARAIAQPVFDAGDKIGARMAFRAAYERALQTARDARRAPCWRLSLGHDPRGRAEAAEAAVALLRLPRESVAQYLQPQEAEGPAATIAGLLAGKAVDPPEDEVARWRELREEVQAKAKVDEEARKAKRAAERASFEAKRTAALSAIERMAENEQTANG